MTNLVKRLRFESPNPNHIASEAANRIETLEQQLAVLRTVLEEHHSLTCHDGWYCDLVKTTLAQIHE
jgi:hypothetical protein